jgi:hypothetical protein
VNNSTNQPVTSNAAKLTVTSAVQPPAITTHPRDTSVVAGANVTFSVMASGTAPFTYQWQKNSVNISGATSATYTKSSVVLADSGLYRCVVNNSTNQPVTSNSAKLTVTISSSSAPTSRQLTVSGTMTDLNGALLNDTVDMVVHLFGVQTGGTEVYSEAFRAAASKSVIIEKGQFAVRLGTGVTTGDLQTTIGNNADLYAEIEVIEGAVSDTLRPRTAITASPYSLAGNIRRGTGDPNSQSIVAPVGSYYIDTAANNTYVRTASTWLKLN